MCNEDRSYVPPAAVKWVERGCGHQTLSLCRQERGHSGAGLASGELLIPDIDFSRINEEPAASLSLAAQVRFSSHRAPGVTNNTSLGHNAEYMSHTPTLPSKIISSHQPRYEIVSLSHFHSVIVLSISNPSHKDSPRGMLSCFVSCSPLCSLI